MLYDIHPIIVHFPIALLFIYSLLVILPVEKWLPSVSWRDIRNFALLIGFIGTVVASSTGELASEINQVNRAILNLHETFAGATQVFYGILVGSLVVKYIISKVPRLLEYRLTRFVLRIVKIVDIRIITILLAILGLLALTLTGVFGGAMVYGVSADPLAAPLLGLFGISV